MVAPRLFLTHDSLPKCRQANSVWQLFNYAEWLAESSGRTLFRMNLDETAICLYPGDGKGTVFIQKKRLRGDRDRRQHVPFSKRRCYVSLVAVVCERADVQPSLPQMIIANERTFRMRAFADLARAAPPNVTLLRQRSAWNNTRLTARFIRALSNALRKLRVRLPNTQPLLVLDAAKFHLHPLVLRACREASIWVLVVPPRMTFVLQPLDARIFAPFKAALIQAYQAARLESTEWRGDVGVCQWLQCIYTAIAEVFEGRSWSAAFDHCGFGARQSLLGRRVCETLQLNEPVDLPPLPPLPPTDDEVRLCFPRNYTVDMPLYWSLFQDVAPQRPLLHRATPMGAPTAESARALAPWRAPRTRAEHREAAAAAEAVASLTRVAPAPGDAPPRPLLRRYPRADVLDAD